MAEGEYNPFFVGLQFIFKEVLNDFDFTNEQILCLSSIPKKELLFANKSHIGSTILIF